MTGRTTDPRFPLDIDGVEMPSRAAALLDAVRSDLVIADGAMGTMLQHHDPTLDDYLQLEAATRSSTSRGPT